MQEDLFRRRKPAAAYFKENYGFGTPSTLAKLAVTGNGPVFCKRGRIPLYRTSDLDDWARSQMTGPQRSTSESPKPFRLDEPREIRPLRTTLDDEPREARPP
jgi:hypothetical protein